MQCSKGLAIAAAFAALGSQLAVAQLNTNGLNGAITFSPNDNWEITAQTPTYLSPTVGTGSGTSFGNAWKLWTGTAAGAGWNLVINNTSGVSFNMLDYTPSINNLGDGDLVVSIGYQQGAGINGGPNPITANRNIYYDTTAAWSQSVLTNVPRLNSLPSTGYLDLLSGPYMAPLYPYQYPTSRFWDDPSRSGNVSSTVNWTGDAFITTLNRNTKTLTVFGGVEWGFSIQYVGMQGAPPPTFEANDIGNIPAAVPEPATPVALGLGLLGLLIRRRRKS